MRKQLTIAMAGLGLVFSCSALTTKAPQQQDSKKMAREAEPNDPRKEAQPGDDRHGKTGIMAREAEPNDPRKEAQFGDDRRGKSGKPHFAEIG